MPEQKNKIISRYDRIAGVYDIMERPMESMFRHWRKEMLSHAEGKVLEVGIGAGKNIPYYPSSEVELSGIDFSKMLSKAKEKSIYGSCIFT